MGARSPRLERPFTCAFALLTLAGCNPRTPESPPPIVVVKTAPHATPTIASAPRAVPTATPAPPALTTPMAEMRPRKTFVDPPLPPELLDDGVLRPLPPPIR